MRREIAQVQVPWCVERPSKQIAVRREASRTALKIGDRDVGRMVWGVSGQEQEQARSSTGAVQEQLDLH